MKKHNYPLIGTILLILLLMATQPLSAQPLVDEIRVIQIDDQYTALNLLRTGKLQIVLDTFRITPDVAQILKTDPNLAYHATYGLYYELTFNPVGPTFPSGELNPFSVPRIREAMNYVIDRNYIVNNILYGFAAPKFFPLIKGFPEYERMKDYLAQLENDYGYNFTKGYQIIQEEMTKLNATLNYGKWWYNGSPVIIKFLIRSEDSRKQIGDYVADQLEKLGFYVARIYVTAREASPIWLRGDPAKGWWHIYTGGWITTSVGRDDADAWAFFYTPLGMPFPLWQAYKPDPVFYEVARKLWSREFETIEERHQMMMQAANLSLRDSVRVWLVDTISPAVLNSAVDAEADLAEGFYSTVVWRTLRYKGGVGGVVNASMRRVLVEPWNPVAGSNWVYDTTLMSATQAYSFISDPYSGLPVPERAISAEVYVLNGTVTQCSSSWLKLTFVSSIPVHPDAWWGFNVSSNRVITAGEAGVKYAQVKIVVNYGDVIGKIKYHDGTTMSMADWVIGWPLTFARVDPSSPLYDEAAVPSFQAWREYFIAQRFVSTSPLVIEYYVNYTALDAELIVSQFANWPSVPWHALAIGIRAEEKGQLAFSIGKADKMKVEWMNYIGGPSLDVLSKMLDESIAEGYIPFKDFLSNYTTVDDAKARYNALKTWYTQHKHFWVGDGPYYLDTANTTAHSTVLKAFIPPAYLAVKGRNNYIYYWISGSWNMLPYGSTPDSPSVLRIGSLLYFAVRGKDNGTYVTYLNLTSNKLASWVRLPGRTPSRPAIAYNGSRIIIVVRGSDNSLYIGTLKTDLTGFSGWVRLPGRSPDAPSIAVLNGELHIVVRGMDNRLWHGRVNASQLDPSTLTWTSIPRYTDKAPSLAAGRSGLVLAVKGLDGLTYLATWNSTWQGWEVVPQGSTADTPAVACINDLAIVFMRREDGSIWMSVRLKPNLYRNPVRIPGYTDVAPSSTP
jgi:peptide/nickel transport system substrate-binding protein